MATTLDWRYKQDFAYGLEAGLGPARFAALIVKQSGDKMTFHLGAARTATTGQLLSVITDSYGYGKLIGTVLGRQ